MNQQAKTYFISDLHLTPERPATIQAFLKFMAGDARSAERLYLLGDLFEYWIGDDAADMLGADIVLGAMNKVSQELSCFFIAGNRDFLVGDDFEKRSGFSILPDETVIDLYNRKTLLLHGDSLCTDDTAHQQFRELMVTNMQWRSQFLSLDIPQRIEQAMQARTHSHKHKSQISMEIMDVAEQSVLDTFSKYHVHQMIHGHTHRQKHHKYSLDGKPASRYVLGDWGKSSSILTADADGIQIKNQQIGG